MYKLSDLCIIGSLKSSKVVEPQTLPRTPVAAKFHSLRVYYQVNECKGNSLDLDP